MTDYRQQDPLLWDAVAKEEERQRQNIELIASENIVSQGVMHAQGSALTNKYAEGYPGKRYYGGTQYVDIVENLAINRAKKNCLEPNMLMFNRIQVPVLTWLHTMHYLTTETVYLRWICRLVDI